jgi:UDP-N-acetylmuramate--alanine ligase
MTHSDAQCVPDFEAAVDFLRRHVRPGDVVLTLGAGDVYRVGERLLEALKASEEG